MTNLLIISLFIGSGSPQNSCPTDQCADQPISDCRVSTTCVGSVDAPDWCPDSIQVENDCGDINGDGMETLTQRVVNVRPRSALKANPFKAIKSGIKSAANWIPNIFSKNAFNANRNCNYSSINSNNNRLKGNARELICHSF